MVNNLRIFTSPTRNKGRNSPSLFDRFISTLGIVRCPCCRILSGEPSSGLCTECLKSIEKQRLILYSNCSVCSLPMQHTATAIQQAANNIESTMQCGQCLSSPPLFKHCVAAVRYAPTVARLINNLKHQGRLSALQIMKREMLLALDSKHLSTIDMLIPVPLHRTRLISRGFNQSLELTKLLGQSLQIPLAPNICVRRKEGQTQQNLNKMQRLANLQHTFEFTQRVDGLRLAIIDDVVTTTATAQSIASAALAAGAETIDIWCFARTPAPD